MKQRLILFTWLYRYCSIGLLCACLYPVSVSSAVTEYQLKAVFLVAYTQFVSWPAHVFSHRSAPYRVCVLGDNPFELLLDLTVQKHNLEQSKTERQVKTQYIRSVNEAHHCQVLYISASEHPRLNSIIQAVQQKPILLVSDIEGFTRQGGMIEFYIRSDNKLRFRIHHKHLQAAHLKASANLLRVADLVEDKD